MQLSTRPLMLVAVVMALMICANAEGESQMTPVLLPAEEWKILEYTNWFNKRGTMLTDHILRLVYEAEARTEAARAAVRTPQDWETRRREVEARLLDILGGLPEKTPLNARVSGRIERDKYAIENVVYDALPGFSVSANLYLPHGRSFPAPTVICPCGHSGKEQPHYQAIGIGMASNGYVALIVDSPDRGERTAPGNDHFRVGALTYLTGANSERYFTWDVIRGIDYLLTREEVNPEKLGCSGLSGGAVSTLHASALDKRVKCVVPVCGVSSLRPLCECLATTCPEQLQQNTLGKQVDEMEIAGLIAPVPLLLMEGQRDDIFFIPDFLHGCEQIAHYYEVLGHRDRILWQTFDAPHSYNREMREVAYRWLGKWIGDDETTATDPAEMEMSTPEELACGLNITSTIFSVNAEIARALAEKQRGKALPDTKQLRNQAIRLLGGVQPVPAAEAVWTGTMRGEGIAVDKVVLLPEPDVQVPLWVLRPEQVEGPLPAVLYATEQGALAEARPGGPIRQLADAGFLVAAMDVRGIGETDMAPTRWDIHSFCKVERIAAYASFVASKPVLGMRVTDVLSVLDYVANRPEVDRHHLAVWGKGQGGVWALYAALLDDRLGALIAKQTPSSYLALATDIKYTWPETMLLPDVLRYHDLPQIAAGLAPRPTMFLNPADSREQPATGEAFAAEYAVARRAYRSTPDAYTVHFGLSEEQATEVAVNWLTQMLEFDTAAQGN